MNAKTTSFLEELKAAQAIIDADTKGGHFDLKGGDYIDVNDEEGSREVAAVLRRIPQLIEVVEMIEGYANLGKTDIVLDNKYVQRQHFAVDILSKLEGKKDE